MTIDDRYLVDVSDLKVVRFECGSCGAALSVRVQDWTVVPIQCPSCSTQWLRPSEESYQTTNRLALGLRGVAAVEKQAAFRIRFEVDRPRP